MKCLRYPALIALLAILIVPVAAGAQQAGKVYRIGVLATVPTPTLQDAFLKGLRERGYVEGKNLLVEYRWSEGRSERFTDLATELVLRHVDAIVTVSNQAAQAAKQATNTIPIVMVTSASPERVGLVASLARPGGNVTGLTTDTGPEIAEKMLQLLKEAAPRVSRVAVLLTTRPVRAEQTLLHDGGIQVNRLQAVAEQLSIALQVVTSPSPTEFEGAFAAITAGQAEALFVSISAVNFLHRHLILEFALKRGIAGVYPFREFAEDGGLLAYGVDLRDMARRSTTYLDKILRGAKPGDLPVEQPTKFELVINLKTANALGLTLPQSLLTRADQLIE
jgi:putative ABC transport system substrate-binding protein